MKFQCLQFWGTEQSRRCGKWSKDEIEEGTWVSDTAPRTVKDWRKSHADNSTLGSLWAAGIYLCPSFLQRMLIYFSFTCQCIFHFYIYALPPKIIEYNSVIPLFAADWKPLCLTSNDEHKTSSPTSKTSLFFPPILLIFMWVKVLEHVTDSCGLFSLMCPVIINTTRFQLVGERWSKGEKQPFVKL